MLWAGLGPIRTGVSPCRFRIYRNLFVSDSRAVDLRSMGTRSPSGDGPGTSMAYNLHVWPHRLPTQNCLISIVLTGETYGDWCLGIQKSPCGDHSARIGNIGAAWGSTWPCGGSIGLINTRVRGTGTLVRRNAWGLRTGRVGVSLAYLKSSGCS